MSIARAADHRAAAGRYRARARRARYLGFVWHALADLHVRMAAEETTRSYGAPRPSWHAASAVPVRVVEPAEEDRDA